MAINKTPVPDARLNLKIRSLFLDHLAQTANVSASALAAGAKSSAVYAERRRTPAFRDAWALALAEGYARLETDLLAEALILKLTQMRQRAEESAAAHAESEPEPEPEREGEANADA